MVPRDVEVHGIVSTQPLDFDASRSQSAALNCGPNSALLPHSSSPFYEELGLQRRSLELSAGTSNRAQNMGWNT